MPHWQIRLVGVQGARLQLSSMHPARLRSPAERLRVIPATFSDVRCSARMTKLITFTCPQTGKRAHVLLPGLPGEENLELYRMVRCPACGRSHSVNSVTGKVLGAPEEEE